MCSASRKLSLMTGFACADCGDDLERDGAKCPACGSRDRLIEIFEVGHGIDVSERLHRLCEQPGMVSRYRKLYSDVRWNSDRRHKEYRIMVVDKENDYYFLERYDLETGKRIWWTEGRIGDPGLHGQFARRRTSDD